MKVYKVVAYSSLAVGLIAALVFASLPLRYPGSSVAWGPAILFALPLAALIALLFVKLALPLRTFRLLLGLTAILGVIAALVHWMAWPVLGLFLPALAALALPLRGQPSQA